MFVMLKEFGLTPEGGDEREATAHATQGTEAIVPKSERLRAQKLGSSWCLRWPQMYSTGLSSGA